MSSRLEWTYNTCLSCDALTDGSTYCSESCRLSEDNKAMERVHNLSLSSTRPETSSTASPRRTISALAERELRTYNMSLDQSKMQRSASR
ncbi:hypothetical protein M441DRAFT_59193 [Trichoderma asperellum CBS 433.97]|uniref:Uncharacterized protein n=1 Tax=Trichoderma asperellum (strain ATCC 204424 / CBS 433.97 / NBRC 101777) TaxID=1042311 RepID=A0A2T3Z6L2_TRIA4|nr:hypothetical protein M441DRAFT_59193 [Trichoderma asperellum CBS 433.97]PTB40443.1 hypothetical protein M441DRAFT_59193 [Trichoderma asperellum CBS 433.97]